jgi:hypothetical protein
MMLIALTLLYASTARAQERPLFAEGTVGYAAFVDESPEHFVLFAAALRQHLTPRLSVGPEFVVMERGEGIRDRAVMLTGNVVFDVLDVGGNRHRVTPFLVGGLGGFWIRERLPGGAFWGNDPAFTTGVGVRARVSERVLVSAEYRVGWELHQRISGTLTYQVK